MTSNGYLVISTVVRMLAVFTGASFAALLLRSSLPVWRLLDAAEKWLAAVLFLYSADMTLYTALFPAPPFAPQLAVNLLILASFLAGHRYLYFVRRDTS